MLRNLLPLLLIASLLAGGWLPCCPPAAQAATAPTAHDCGGGADPSAPDTDPAPAPATDCDDCRHCLQSPPLTLRLASLPGVAPQQHAAASTALIDPQRQPAPLQRPPIPHLG